PTVFPQPPEVARPVEAKPKKRPRSGAGVVVLVVLLAALAPMLCVVPVGGILFMLLWPTRVQMQSLEPVHSEVDGPVPEPPDMGMMRQVDPPVGPVPGVPMPGPPMPGGAAPGPPPLPGGPPPGGVQMLKKFDPKVDKPIAREVLGRKVTEEEGGWRIRYQNEQEQASLEAEPNYIPLFEISRPAVKGRRVTLRAQVRTE